MKKNSAAAISAAGGRWAEETTAAKEKQAPAPPHRPVKKQLERTVTEDVNESAEAFIKKFRNQLLIQRLDSIENYQKMLAGETQT